MRNVEIPYLVIKKGKYCYWQPSAELKAKGWKPESLGTDKQEAKAKAIEINRRLAEWYEGHKLTAPVKHTVAWLIEEYKASDMYTGLRPRTRTQYAQQLETIKRWAGDVPVTAVTRRAVLEEYKAIVDGIKAKGGSGLTHGAHFVRILRIVMNFARNEELITANPAEDLKIKNEKPRRQVWEEAEIVSFIAKAEELQSPSMALAVMLGVFTGQRPADVRAMTWGAYDGRYINVTQEKTGELVRVYCLDALKALLDTTPRTAVQILTTDGQGVPYEEDHFIKSFAHIREQAGIRKDLQYRDLRRTAVVYLSRAGCTVQEISSITGHRIESCQAIMNTYFPKDAEAGRNAVLKLEDYRSKTWNR